MRRDVIENCPVLQASVKKQLIQGLDSLEGHFAAARDCLARGEEAEFLKNLSQARSLINDLSYFSLTVIVEDCTVWCEEEDLSERILQGISASL